MTDIMKKFTYLAAAAFALLCSCTKEIDFNGDYTGEKIVLFSCANPDQALTATVYKSVFIYSKDAGNCTQTLSGAKVTVIVNGKDTYTFKEVKTVYEHDSEDYWMYGGKEFDTEYVSEYIPKPGDHIVVKASYPGLKDVQGETAVPQRPVARISSSRVEDNPDNEYWDRMHFSVTITDPAGEENYYRLNAMTESKGQEWDEYAISQNWHVLYSRDVIFYDTSVGGMLESIGGSDFVVPDLFDDGSFNGQSHTFPVWFEFYSDPEEGTEIPEKCTVTVDNISESLFKYGKSIAAYNGNEGFASIFGEMVIIYSNVENGLGCVGAVAGTEVIFQP